MKSAVIGFCLVLLSAFLFAISGPIGKTMYAIGWTPSAVVLVRLIGCALILLIPTLIALRGRWAEVRARWRTVVAYGFVSIAAVQLTYFLAAEHLSIAVAILLQMTAPALIVLWLWLRTRVAPHALTFAGIAVAGVGLVFVLDLRGADVSPLGAALALSSAVCLAYFFIASAKSDLAIPSLALIGLGMIVGAAALGIVVLIGALPGRIVMVDVDFGGWRLPWWAPMVLIVVATVAAYLAGVIGLRLVGAAVGAFVNLTEVPFSVIAAWLLISEAPKPVQMFGGLFILVGIAFVKAGEMRLDARARRTVVDLSEEADPPTGPLDAVTGSVPVVTGAIPVITGAIPVVVETGEESAEAHSDVVVASPGEDGGEDPRLT